jgi:phosphopentomutase
VAGPRVRTGADLGVRESFRDLSATLEEWFEIEPSGLGRSALSAILS